jgi:hypothetical protein
MAQATSYNISGKHDSLLDVVTTVNPEETPLFSSARKGVKPKSVLTEWVTDKLDNPSLAGKVEGVDVTTHVNRLANRATVSNRVQTVPETWAVSREVQQSSDIAGVKNAVAESKAKALLQLKLDMAAITGSDQEAVTGTASAANLTRGLGKWLDATNANIPASVRLPAAQIAKTGDLAAAGGEVKFNAVLQATYEASGAKRDYTLYAGPGLKSVITNFTRASGATTNVVVNVPVDAEKRKITLAVDVYDGDFGLVKIVPDLFLGRATGTGVTAESRDRGYLVTPSLFELGFLEAPTHVDQPDQGGGQRGFFEAMFAVRVLHPWGFAKFVTGSTPPPSG